MVGHFVLAVIEVLPVVKVDHGVGLALLGMALFPFAMTVGLRGKLVEAFHLNSKVGVIVRQVVGERGAHPVAAVGLLDLVFFFWDLGQLLDRLEIIHEVRN